MKKILISALITLGLIVCFSSASNADISNSNQVEQNQVYVSYCCDAQSVRRCILNAPAPVNTVCFCFGQGYGWTCL